MLTVQKHYIAHNRGSQENQWNQVKFSSTTSASSVGPFMAMKQCLAAKDTAAEA